MNPQEKKQKCNRHIKRCSTPLIIRWKLEQCDEIFTIQEKMKYAVLPRTGVDVNMLIGTLPLDDTLAPSIKT